MERRPRQETARRYPNFEDRRVYIPEKFTSQDSKTTSYSITTSEVVIYVDTTNGNIKVTLPAVANLAGKFYYIKKVDSSNNAVTVDGNGSETIDGEEELVINRQYAYILIHCDGSEWFILGGEYVKIESILEEMLSRQIEWQEKELLRLGKIERHLQEVTDLNLKEGDVNDRD